MISTTAVHVCPHCGGERLQKNGHTQRGAERTRCVECRRTFTLSPKGPRHSQKVKAQVLAAYQDRMAERASQTETSVRLRLKRAGWDDADLFPLLSI